VAEAVREWLLAPLLAPLRTAVRAFFTYLRLNETQAAAHTSVAVPLRLLLRHATDLQSDFAAGMAATPARGWSGVVPQLFGHPEPTVRSHVQTLLIAIGRRLPQLVLCPAIVGADETLAILTDAVVSTAALPMSARKEMVSSEGARERTASARCPTSSMPCLTSSTPWRMSYAPLRRSN
jgi:hypothetical protein